MLTPEIENRRRCLMLGAGVGVLECWSIGLFGFIDGVALLDDETVDPVKT